MVPVRVCLLVAVGRGSCWLVVVVAVVVVVGVILCKQSRGVFLFEVTEAPQAAATQTHRAIYNRIYG